MRARSRQTGWSFTSAPFVLVASYNCVHKPLEVPPASLVPANNPYESFGQPQGSTPDDLYEGKAMIEAMDYEIGNLLDAIPPDVMARTNVILVGDNGTQRDLIEPPFLPRHGKATVWRHGVQVPLIISGPRVSAAARGQSCDALVDLTDLLPTIGEITGSAAPAPLGDDPHLGSSLVPFLADLNASPRRAWIFAERFKPNYNGYGDPRANSELIFRATHCPMHGLTAVTHGFLTSRTS